MKDPAPPGDPPPEAPPPLDRHIRALRWLRRGIVFLAGLSVVLLGIVMIFTPGPAFLVIPLGIVILATEFVWARRLLRKVRDHLRSHGVDPAAKSPLFRRMMARLGIDGPEEPPNPPE